MSAKSPRSGSRPDALARAPRFEHLHAPKTLVLYAEISRRLLLLRQLDGPQGLIVRDLIKMHTSLFKDGTLGKHRGQCLHLFGCVEIRPDADIDDGIGDRINSCMVVKEATQLLQCGNQRVRRCLNEPVYLVVLWRGKVPLRNAATSFAMDTYTSTMAYTIVKAVYHS